MAAPAKQREPDFEYGVCRQAELPILVSQVDGAFISGKGRHISLSERFPSVLHKENLHNILVARVDSQPVASLAMRTFEWNAYGNRWQGAMLGMVNTCTDYRGRGVASALLGSAERSMRERGLDFAVLWTGKPEFYARLGWSQSESGFLATHDGDPNPGEACSRELSVTGVAANVAWIESVRHRWQAKWVARDSGAYQHLPIPAESVGVAKIDAKVQQGYVLFGRRGNTLIVYEMVGHPQSFDALWQYIRSHAGPVIINVICGTLANKWLRCHTPARWTVQHQAMWLSLSERTHGVRWYEWHIPYFDRI